MASKSNNTDNCDDKGDGISDGASGGIGVGGYEPAGINKQRIHRLSCNVHRKRSVSIRGGPRT